MSTSHDDEVVSNITRTLQIITGSLVAGPTVFLVIVLFITNSAAGPRPGPQPATPAPAPSGTPLVTYMAFLFAAVGLPLAFVIPGFMAKSQRRSIAKGAWKPPQVNSGSPLYAGEIGDRGKLAMVYMTQTIIGAAMIEGVAFFSAIAYLLERRPAALILALALIATVAARIPTRDRISQWIEEQLGLMAQERQFIE